MQAVKTNLEARSQADMDLQRLRIKDRIRELESEMALESQLDPDLQAEDDYDDEAYGQELRTSRQNSHLARDAYGNNEDESQGSELEDPELSELSGSAHSDEEESSKSHAIHALIQHSRAHSSQPY